MDAVVVSKFAPSSPRRWVGELDLTFAQLAGRTRVSHSEHRGPLRIQRPFYPEADGTAHLYLLHPPGGVAGGDELHVRIGANTGSHALVTTPAANKLYRVASEPCSVSTTIDVQDAATIEWLPQETIAFEGARGHLSTVVHLEEGARFVGWELLCLGRPAAGEGFEKGEIVQSIELWREETPLFVDRMRLGGSSKTIHSAWGLQGGCVVGTLLLAPGTQEHVERLRELVTLSNLTGRAAVTDLRGVTLLRYVGKSTTECWDLFVAFWQEMRPLILQCPAVHPRIWSY